VVVILLACTLLAKIQTNERELLLQYILCSLDLYVEHHNDDEIYEINVVIIIFYLLRSP